MTTPCQPDEQLKQYVETLLEHVPDDDAYNGFHETVAAVMDGLEPLLVALKPFARLGRFLTEAPDEIVATYGATHAIKMRDCYRAVEAISPILEAIDR